MRNGQDIARPILLSVTLVPHVAAHPGYAFRRNA